MDPQIALLITAHISYSFPCCYGAAFAKLSPTMDGGVPVEHLITCIPNVQMKVDKLGMKRVVWVESRPSSPAESSISENSATSGL